MKILQYNDLTSPFFQPKVFLHLEKFKDISEGKIPVPVTCEIDLTDGFCNNKCRHCFFSTNTKNKPIYLDKHIAKSVIRELHQHGVKGIEFSGGGEPTTHPDFKEILLYAPDIGCSVGLITNGLLLDKIMDDIDSLSFIRISLDASNSKTYEKIHGVPYFEKVIDNISELTKHMNPLKIGVGYLIVEDNISDIIEAAKVVKQLGCRFIQYRPASLPYDTNPQIWIKAHENIQKAMMYSDENFQIFDAGVKWKHINGDRCYQKCYTSSLVAVIKANGDIPLCILNRNNEDKIIGNIHNGGFFKQWYSERHKEFLSQIDVQTCRKPCKHDSYNIAYEAYMLDLYNKNFI